MFSLSWLRERGVTRGRPPARRVGRFLALGAMIVAGLLQTGCRSGPFSRCGFVGRATSKVIVQPIRRVASALTCCGGSGVVSDVPIEYGEPIGVVAPVVPFGATPAPIIEGSPVPSTVAPTNPDAPTNLEPLPRAEPGPSPSNRGSGVRQPSSYDSQRPAASPARGDNLAHTLISTPDPEVRPARDAAKPLNRTAATSDLDGVLDHLPPLDLPPEVTNRSDSPPVAPAAAKPQQQPAAAPSSTEAVPAAAAAVAPPAVSARTPADDHSGGRSDGGAELAMAAPDIGPAASETIGVDRFVVVDLNLAGGSAPSTVGLGWLADRGYKTILDLRDSSEFNSSFIGEAAKRGLRYVALPTDLNKLDPQHIDRFAAELALNDARPLYFFDGDGSRAGAMWYIRRVLTDKVGWDIARREAEEIGLTAAEPWKKVREAVDRQLAHALPASTPTPAPTPAPAPTQTPKPTASIPTPANHDGRSIIEAIRTATTSLPDAWRPAAALILTGLSFPLAYVGRAVILPVILAKSRASLPGPGPQPKLLPPASDA